MEGGHRRRMEGKAVKWSQVNYAYAPLLQLPRDYGLIYEREKVIICASLREK